MEPELLTTEETAKLLNVTVWSMNAWARDGVGPPYRQYRERGSRHYDKVKLLVWLKSREVAA